MNKRFAKLIGCDFMTYSGILTYHSFWCSTKIKIIVIELKYELYL